MLATVRRGARPGIRGRRRFAVHQLTVDTYAVQHPGVPERRAIRSVAVHLMTLARWAERGLDPCVVSTLRRRMVSRSDHVWLEPPRPIGTLTVADVHGVATPEEHRRRVEAWARDVWRAWAPHRTTVEVWLERALGS